MTGVPLGLQTRLVHGGEESREGELVPPIHRSSTYELGNPESFDDIRYIRLNNTPTQRAVERKLGMLEGGSALVTPSGTAAIWLALEALLEPGDEVLAPLRIYGGTKKIFDSLEHRESITMRTIDVARPESWEAALTAKTRVFYAETISNPWMRVADLRRVVEFARAHSLVTIIDNTLATPVLCRPLELGIDVSLHSASKALNGHSDVVAGAIIANAETTLRIRKVANRVGICPDPEACYLLNRGMKTLGLRVAQQNATALELARMLAEHPGVESVSYPGLATDPEERAIAERTLECGFGSLLSFVPVGGVERAKRLIESLRWAREAPSLGGAEMLVCRPATTSHGGLPAELREAMGVGEDMVRVSVGIENRRGRPRGLPPRARGERRLGRLSGASSEDSTCGRRRAR